MDAINKRTAEKAELSSDNNVKRHYDIVNFGELYILKKIGKKVHGFILIGGIFEQEISLKSIARLCQFMRRSFQVNSMRIIDNQFSINIQNSGLEINFAYYDSTNHVTVRFINKEYTTTFIMRIRNGNHIYISMNSATIILLIYQQNSASYQWFMY